MMNLNQKRLDLDFNHERLDLNDTHVVRAANLFASDSITYSLAVEVRPCPPLSSQQPRKVYGRLHGKGDSNTHGARPVH